MDFSGVFLDGEDTDDKKEFNGYGDPSRVPMFDMVPEEFFVNHGLKFDPNNHQDLAMMDTVIKSEAHVLHNSNPLNPTNSSLVDNFTALKTESTVAGAVTEEEGISTDLHRSLRNPFQRNSGKMMTLSIDANSMDTSGSTTTATAAMTPPSTQFSSFSSIPPAPPPDFQVPPAPPIPPSGFIKPRRNSTPRRTKRKRYETVVASFTNDEDSDEDENSGLTKREVLTTKSSAQLELDARRRKHNEIESRRRKKINHKFTLLRELTQSQKPDRGSVLMAAIEKLQEFEKKQHSAHAEIERLKKEVADSQKKIASIVKKSPDILRPVYVKEGSAVSDVDYREVFLKSGVAMSLARVDGQFIDCNVAFEKMTGFTRAELLTTNMFALTHPSDLPKMFACVRGMLAGAYSLCKAVKKWVQKNGELFKCSCMISVVNDPTNPKYPKYFVCFGPSHAELEDEGVEDVMKSEVQDTAHRMLQQQSAYVSYGGGARQVSAQKDSASSSSLHH